MSKKQDFLSESIRDESYARQGLSTGTAYNSARLSQLKQEREQDAAWQQQRYNERFSYGSSPSGRGMAFEELLGLSVAGGGAWWGYTSNLVLPWYGWGIGFMAVWGIATLFFYWAAWLTMILRVVLTMTFMGYGLYILNDVGILTVENVKWATKLLAGLVYELFLFIVSQVQV